MQEGTYSAGESPARMVKRRFSMIPEELVCDGRVKAIDVRVFSVLDRHAGNERACWLLRETIATEATCSLHDVSRATGRLEAAGWVHVFKSRTASLFVLRNPAREVLTFDAYEAKVFACGLASAKKKWDAINLLYGSRDGRDLALLSECEAGSRTPSEAGLRTPSEAGSRTQKKTPEKNTPEKQTPSVLLSRRLADASAEAHDAALIGRSR